MFRWPRNFARVPKIAPKLFIPGMRSRTHMRSCSAKCHASLCLSASYNTHRMYVPCDICGAANPRLLLESPGLDGPLVECPACGFRYVGERRSRLAFGHASPEETAAQVRVANQQFRYLRLEEE